MSCTKDKENPTISITSPENHSNHMIGGAVSVSATFSDDLELSYYHVHIGNENGNHTMEFMYEDYGSLTGKTYEFTNSISVPDTIGSVYYLHFQVLDTQGKETKEKIMLHFM